ncbi:hypothetical protein C8R47DRAFT_1227645 [Mycena vitilis]|nr:hypothetical protein C8R47DRAFT_1227645 [Mycena vitilis]
MLGAHVTRTPVTTPGPPVPGGFPAHLKPDPQPVLSSVALSATVAHTGHSGSSASPSLFSTNSTVFPALVQSPPALRERTHLRPHALSTPPVGANSGLGAASSAVATPPGSLPSLDGGYAARAESESLATPPALPHLTPGSVANPY